jgi:hypothetical protein
VLLCSQDYNPFADVGNARIHIMDKSFDDGGEVAIFTTHELVLAPAVAALIDSFSVSIDSNRYERDTTIETVRTGHYTFRLSFVDTGRHEVRVRAYRGRDMHAWSLRVHAFSPLHQDTVNGVFGEPLELATDSVGDGDVMYHWSFGNNTTVSSLSPRATATIHTADNDRGSGLLWVSDKHHRSSAVVFAFSLVDTGAPLIEWLNHPDGDTLVSADTIVPFKVRITDQGGGAVDSVTINGSRAVPDINDVYTRSIHGLRDHPPSSALPLVVYAVDNLEFGNAVRDTFWLAYDSSAITTRRTELLIANVKRDTVVSRTPLFRVFGSVNDYSGATVTVHLDVNGEGVADTLYPGGAGEWGWTFSLPRTRNIVTITALDDKGEVLSHRTMTVFYDAGLVDTAGPVFLEVSVNGTRRHRVIVDDTVAVVRVTAFDEGTGIASLTIGGERIEPSAEGYRWAKTIGSLAHADPGTKVAIRASDSLGNSSDTAVTIYRNRPPRFVGIEGIPYPAVTDSLYTGRINVRDDDGDVVEVIVTHAPAGMTVTEFGLITWQTGTATGADSLVVQLYDELAYTGRISRPMHVVAPAERPDAVVLATTHEAFPPFLEVGVDTLRVSLGVVEGGGRPPYTYDARVPGTQHVLLDSTHDSMLLWAPALDDTGTNVIECVARDFFGIADTLRVSVMVVPANRPCTLRIGAMPDTTASGALDLSRAAAPETLVVRIDDPDLRYGPPAETHDVRAVRGTGSRPVAIDGEGRGVILLDPPDAEAGFDTLTLTVTDRTGSSDTLALALYYGTPPAAPVPLHPADSASLSDTTVGLRWRCTDPDGDTLRYDVYMGPAGAVERVAREVSDTLYSVTGLVTSGVYYWRVVARDRTSAVTGPTRSVRLRNPRHVELAVDAGDFPSFVEAGRTMSVALGVREGTGKEPLRYGALHVEKDRALVTSETAATLSWTPLADDTGHQHLRITVEDGWGNGDTLGVTVLVVPANAHPCSLAVEHTAALTADGAVDLSGGNEADTARITIVDRDHPLTERYTVRTIDRHATTVETLDSATTFALITAPEAARRGLDTIRVIVGDRTGTFDTLDMRLWYGRSAHGGSVKIRINTTGIAAMSAPVYDIPLLVRLDEASFDFTGLPATDPPLRFVKAGGGRVPYQLDTWDPVAGRAAIWILADTVRPADDTWYATLVVDEVARDSSDGDAVFRRSDGFQGVWHMNLVYHNGWTVRDATANGNHGTVHGAGENDVVATPLGSSILFDSTTTYIDCGNHASLSPGNDRLTLEAWVRLGAGTAASGYMDIVSKGNHSYLMQKEAATPTLLANVYDGTSYRNARVHGIAEQTWYHVAATYDGSRVRLYLDGERVDDAFAPWITTTSHDVNIGRNAELAGRFFDGIIDEVRISSVARGRNWIVLSYENQKAGSGVVTVE